MSIRSVRGVVVAIVAACVVAAGPAAVAGAATGSPGTATLEATPHSNLRDGQMVTVEGSGYPANVTTDLVQCEQGVGCDFGTLFLQDTDADGNYTTTFPVRRILSLGSGTVDCATKQDCVLVSLDITDISDGIGAQTAITFDPNAPFKPPVHFRVMPDPTGHVTVDKGVARVTGTVACNQAVTIQADIVLTQVYGRSIFRSETFVEIACQHGGKWAAVFRPVNGLFDTGAAKLHVDAFGFAATSTYEQSQSHAITLVPRAS
jgi:neocarzinostatin family protein